MNNNPRHTPSIAEMGAARPTPQAMPQVALSELDGAQEDLARLGALLKDAFGELMSSFSAVQQIARDTGAGSEMERLAGRAIVALQCEDMASQLIGHTRKRLAGAAESLKILPEMPHIALTSMVWAAGIATAGEYLPPASAIALAPVQQDAMAAGSMELF